MDTSNNKTMAVKEEVEHTSDIAGHDADGEHVAIRTDTYAVAEEALGEHLPQHYYRSVGFIGTVAVSQPPMERIAVANFHRHYVLEISATTLAGSCQLIPSP